MDFSKSLDSLLEGKPSFPTSRAPSNANVKKILKHLDNINQTKSVHKRLKRCEALIYKISSALRHTEQDHLYQTTSIWILINVFRLDPPSVREIMIQAGIPGVLYEVLRSRLLTGSTRQYASELCFYLRYRVLYQLICSCCFINILIKIMNTLLSRFLKLYSYNILILFNFFHRAALINHTLRQSSDQL